MTNHSPHRIASLQPSATVILAAIGELGRVVACTKYCADVVPEIISQRCAVLSDSWTANSEQIISANPDLVIASVPYQEKAVIEILKSGTRFLGFAPKTLADIYMDIAIIAGIVDASAAGNDVVEAMRKQIEQFRMRTAGLPRPRVFCEEWGKPLIASQAWVAELVDAAGGEFLGVPGKQIPAEEVAHLDPDVLIASWCGAGDRVPLERSWPIASGTELAQFALPVFFAFATNTSIRPLPRCSTGSKRWHSLFILMYLLDRKESGKLPAFHLLRTRVSRSELRFSLCPHGREWMKFAKTSRSWRKRPPPQKPSCKASANFCTRAC